MTRVPRAAVMYAEVTRSEPSWCCFSRSRQAHLVWSVSAVLSWGDWSHSTHLSPWGPKPSPVSVTLGQHEPQPVWDPSNVVSGERQSKLLTLRPGENKAWGQMQPGIDWLILCCVTNPTANCRSLKIMMVTGRTSITVAIQAHTCSYWGHESVSMLSSPSAILGQYEAHIMQKCAIFNRKEDFIERGWRVC